MNPDGSFPSRAEVALVPEVMDGPLPYPEARRALRDLDRVNRLLLGVTAVRRTFGPLLAAHGGTGRPARVLDLGAGSGRIANALVRAAARRGATVRMVLLDRRLTHLAIGRSERRGSGGAATLSVAASADALPFRDDAFDWSFSNLFFHHFGAAENRVVVDEMLRCSRAGAVVVDLRRSRLAAWLARLLFPFLGVGEVALHDGLLSLAQSWTPSEVRGFASERPDARIVELRRRFPFRWSLVLSPSSASRSRGVRADARADRAPRAADRSRPPR